MNNQQQVQTAVTAGLELTDPESDLLKVFRQHGTGVLMLRSLLQQIDDGTVALIPTDQLQDLQKKAAAVPPPPEPDDDD